MSPEFEVTQFSTNQKENFKEWCDGKEKRLVFTLSSGDVTRASLEVYEIDGEPAATWYSRGYQVPEMRSVFVGEKLAKELDEAGIVNFSEARESTK